MTIPLFAKTGLPLSGLILRHDLYSPNLLKWSEAFDNAAWTKQRSTIAANCAADPISGAMTVDKLVEDGTAGNSHSLDQSAGTAGAGIQGYLLRAGGRSRILTYVDSGVPTTVGFDLETGTVTTNGAGAYGSMTSLGGGWWFCLAWGSFSSASRSWRMVAAASPVHVNTSYSGLGHQGTAAAGGSTTTAVLAAGASATDDVYNGTEIIFSNAPTTIHTVTDYVGATKTLTFTPARASAPNGTTYTVGPGIYIARAQLSVGSVLPEYVKTTDNQWIENTAQGANPNLIQRSEEFSNAVWTKTRSTITADAVANPVNGLVDADKLVEDGSSGTHPCLCPNADVAAGSQVVGSVYFEKGERDYGVLLIQDGASAAIGVAYFNLVNGTVASNATGVAAIVNAGGGWYRCSVSGTCVVASARMVVYPSVDGVPANLGYQGDGTSGLYIWGAQLEPGTTPTPYRSTQGRLVLGSAAEADTNDPTLLGNGIGFSGTYDGGNDNYLLAGNLSNVNMAGPFSLLIAGKFDGVSGTILSLAGGATDFARVAYNGQSKVRIGSKAGAAAETNSADLIVDGGPGLVLAFTSDSTTLTLTNIATGVAVTLATQAVTGTPRVGAGATATTTVATIASQMTGYDVMSYNRKVSASEQQQVRRYVKSKWLSRGLFLPAATNLCTNPSFEVATAGLADSWMASGTVFGTTLHDLVAGRTGGYAQRVRWSNPAPSYAVAGWRTLDFLTPVGSFATGDYGTGSAYVKGSCTGTGLSATLDVKCCDAAGGSLLGGGGASATLPVGEWTRLSYTRTMSHASTSRAKITLVVSGLDGPDDSFEVLWDDACLVNSSVLTPHFDGSYPDCAWTGTADASTSTRPANTIEVIL